MGDQAPRPPQRGTPPPPGAHHVDAAPEGGLEVEPVGSVSPPPAGIGSGVDQVEDEASLPDAPGGWPRPRPPPPDRPPGVRSRGRADQHRRGDPGLSGVPRIGQLAPLATQPPVLEKQPLSLPPVGTASQSAQCSSRLKKPPASALTKPSSTPSDTSITPILSVPSAITSSTSTLRTIVPTAHKRR